MSQNGLLAMDMMSGAQLRSFVLPMCWHVDWAWHHKRCGTRDPDDFTVRRSEEVECE